MELNSRCGDCPAAGRYKLMVICNSELPLRTACRSSACLSGYERTTELCAAPVPSSGAGVLRVRRSMSAEPVELRAGPSSAAGLYGPSRLGWEPYCGGAGDLPGRPRKPPSARHRAQGLGTGGSSRRAERQEEFCPPFLCRKDAEARLSDKLPIF